MRRNGESARHPRALRRRRVFLALLVASALAASAAAGTAPASAARSGAEIVRNTCSLCHGPGLSGAPRVGSVRDWRPRLREGLDGLVRSASAGKGAMPVRGGMPDLTDDELRAAIAFMAGLDESRGETK